MNERVYLLLGSNQGDREHYLKSALADLAEAASGGWTQSALYETAAWGLEDQPAFLNLAVGFDTAHTPVQLLHLIRDIEERYGRQRVVVWGQRTLDIDILLFGSLVTETETLSVPHPRLEARRFALMPLAEIAPTVIHPKSGATITELLTQCTDQLAVRRIDWSKGQA